MESKFSENIKKELKEIEPPESLYDFANQVPDIVESMNLDTPSNNQRKRRVKKIIFATMIALACSALFMFGVNQSTSFANYVDKIRFLSELSELLKVDSGVGRAVDHGLLQDVSQSAQDKGIYFTIDNVIAGEKRTFVSFHINIDPDQLAIEEVNLINFKATDGSARTLFGSNDKGEELQIRQRSVNKVDQTTFTGLLEIVSSDSTITIPNTIDLSIHSMVVTKPDKIETMVGDWDVRFQRDAAHSKPIEYKGNDFSINVGSEKLDLKINYIKVYPTLTEMSIDLETELNKGIYYEYHLENENGKVYKLIGNGIHTDSGDVMPQFESSYFEPSQKLFLVMDKVVTVGPKGTWETFEVNKKIELIK